MIDRPSAEEPYSPATDPWFECDTTGHLFTTFGDAYVLHVEPHDDTFRCYIALSGDMPVFARFTAADPRDVLALAVSLENAVRMENGDPPCDAPFSGFMVFARLIHNPFTDPERGQWLFSGRQELRHPREEYGAAYDGWLDALA